MAASRAHFAAVGTTGIVVEEPRPIRPSPYTTQYGCLGKPPPEQLPPPSAATQGRGWAQAWLENKLDVAYRSFADKYFVVGEAYRWYFLTVDGWVLCFWDGDHFDPEEAKAGRMQPAGWLDLRYVHSVTWRPAGGLAPHACPFEVLVHTRTGVFLFSVPTKDDALAWNQRITAAFVEWQSRCIDVREQAIGVVAADRNAQAGAAIQGRASFEDAKFNHEEDKDEVVSIPPYRGQLLRKLWIDCLRAVSHGDTPFIWDQLFSLYDFNGDGTIEIDEMERLLKELLSVRRDELKKTLEQTLKPNVYAMLAQTKQEAAAEKALHQLAGQLLSHYRSLLQGPSFRHRSLVLRSQLDVSRDGLVSLDEFTRGAPQLLLPPRELALEAKFYRLVGEKIERQARERGHIDDDSEDEGGCIQQ